MAMEKTKRNNIGIVLLAAGESSRMGRPKQLLKHGDLTLLQHSIHVAHEADVSTIVVVLGAHADSMNNDFSTKSVFVTNSNWKEGMASSIQLGIKSLLDREAETEGAILMVCDQPYVNSLLLNTLIETYKTTGKQIVASGYDNTFGPPVFFHKLFFPELLQLKGDVGAKSVIKKHEEQVEIVLFPEGSIDIDTDVDYQKLLKATGA